MRGDLLLCFGVARVHLIYRTLRNAEGTTPKLNHYPSEAPGLQQALQPRIASYDAPALQPYELQHFPTTLQRIFTMFSLGTRTQIPTRHMLDTLGVQTTSDSNVPSGQNLGLLKMYP